MSDQTAIQIINEEKQFSPTVLPYFKQILQENDIDQNYHVISVFGSQSSGKSTLLNVLFNTQFDTMDAQLKRQQTTKGIWLAHTRDINNNNGDHSPLNEDIFVLDVEGSDGAERGEDQDFERKAALFAISVSEVLIVNLWEQQIGLYQGNNMALLKTVFEVNLSLFGNSHQKKKVLLLFVIRDHVGVTPIESLSESLISELESVWKDLNKPVGSENVDLYDFFDLKFVGLGHKVLQNEKFIQDVKNLGDSFSQAKETYFKPIYHHMLPLDGWGMYAQNCWDQIENNKDLDLPTQQILVARFKTNEILEEVFSKHFKDYDNIITPIVDNKDKLLIQLKSIKDECLKEYDDLASRYTKQVYLENRDSLISKINKQFDISIKDHLMRLTDVLTKELQDDINNAALNKKMSFINNLMKSIDTATEIYSETLREFNENGLLTSLEEKKETFDQLMNEKSVELKANELKSIISRLKKSITFDLKDEVISLLSNPSPDVWDKILTKFENILTKNLDKYRIKKTVPAILAETNGELSDSKEDRIEEESGEPSYDFEVGLTQEENNATVRKIRFNAWLSLSSAVHDYLKPDTVVGVLRDIFENSFRYDENDSPILWNNEEEIDESFKLAKQKALEVLDILCIAKTSENIEVVPDVDIENEEEYEDENGIYHMTRFSHILNELEKEKVLKQFKRQINITVIDSKRSIMRMTTHIPVWIYVLIVVLGWNEFMMVIRNPFYVTMLFILSVGFYFIHRYDLWDPVVRVVSVAIGETKDTVKGKLREYVLDDHEKTAPKTKEI